MNTPVSLTGENIKYVSTALAERITDLKRVESLLESAISELNFGRCLPAFPDLPALASDLRERCIKIAQSRENLETVLSTIDPAEAIRVWSANTTPLEVAFAAFGLNPAGLYSAFKLGKTIGFERIFSESIIRVVPKMPPSTNRVNLISGKTVTDVSPPANIAERIARIPSGEARIRIDRYGSPASPEFEVYISGTDFSKEYDSPFGAGSNIALLTTGSAASLQAVKKALASAGVTKNSPLVITGHSQGGMIALSLANSGEYRVKAVITAGTPVGVTGGTEAIPSVHLVGQIDPVPALGGLVSNSGGTTWVGQTGESPMVSHHAKNYVNLARTIESFNDPTLGRLERQLQESGYGEARWYAAGRAN